jgi:hypothetical protein
MDVSNEYYEIWNLPGYVDVSLKNGFSVHGILKRITETHVVLSLDLPEDISIPKDVITYYSVRCFKEGLQ